jgi:hypothetical protein
MAVACPNHPTTKLYPHDRFQRRTSQNRPPRQPTGGVSVAPHPLHGGRELESVLRDDGTGQAEASRRMDAAKGRMMNTPIPQRPNSPPRRGGGEADGVVRWRYEARRCRIAKAAGEGPRSRRGGWRFRSLPCGLSRSLPCCSVAAPQPPRPFGAPLQGGELERDAGEHSKMWKL